MTEMTEKYSVLFNCKNVFVFSFSNLLLNTNLSHQSLSTLTSIYYMLIAVFGHLWGLLHHTVCYFKSCMPYQGECMVYCDGSSKNMYLPEKVCAPWKSFPHIIQLHSQKALTLSVNMIVHSKQGKGNRFHGFEIFDLPWI